MLKIKSNTNEFTIIFSEKIEKKINAKKFSVPALFLSFLLFQPSFLFLFSATFFLFFCFSPLSCFCSAPLFLFSVSTLFLSFLLFQHLLFFFLFQHLILFFLPTSKAKNILFRCFTFLLFE